MAMAYVTGGILVFDMHVSWAPNKKCSLNIYINSRYVKCSSSFNFTFLGGNSKLDFVVQWGM